MKSQPYSGAEKAGLLLLEEGEYRVGSVAVDVRLLHEGERHAVVQCAKAGDIVVGARFLLDVVKVSKTSPKVQEGSGACSFAARSIPPRSVEHHRI